MTDSRPWFKAKTYGWGWGPALTWQGWAVYAAYVALVAACALWLPAEQHPLAFGGSIGGLTVVLTGICWLKGEKPKWRWGRS